MPVLLGTGRDLFPSSQRRPGSSSVGWAEHREAQHGGNRVFPSVGHLTAGFALSARYFSLLRQRKVSKRKAALDAWLPNPLSLQGRYAALPCASRRFGRSPNSQDLPRLRLANPAQTGRLAQSQTGCDARQRLRVSGMVPQVPLPSPSTAAKPGNRSAPCSRQDWTGSLIPFRLRVARDARFGEERRESAPADEGCGCLSLWVLSLGQARESTSPERAKPGLESPMKIKPGKTPRRTPPCVPIPQYGTIPLIHTKHTYLKEPA